MAAYPEYSGMSYEQASREAARLIERFGWLDPWDRLAALRDVLLSDEARFDRAANAG